MTVSELTFAGKTLRLDFLDGADQSVRDLANGSYEAPLPMLMMATLVRSTGAFIDVGANSGVYSVLAGVIAPNRQILAFEPLPSAIETIERNIKENNLTGSVRLHKVALSNRTGRAPLHLPDPAHGLLETSASLEAAFKKIHRITEVELCKLDDLDIPFEVGLIKVDIEGHEHAFLEGAMDTIRRNRPIIFCEVLSVARLTAMTNFIRAMSYIDFRLRPDLAINDGPVMFDNAAWNHAFIPEEKMQIFKDASDSCGVTLLRRFKFT